MATGVLTNRWVFYRCWKVAVTSVPELDRMLEMRARSPWYSDASPVCWVQPPTRVKFESWIDQIERLVNDKLDRIWFIGCEPSEHSQRLCCWGSLSLTRATGPNPTQQLMDSTQLSPRRPQVTTLRHLITPRDDNDTLTARERADFRDFLSPVIVPKAHCLFS